MNENELRTIEENEDNNGMVQLYEDRKVETEEDDGPGFGLGILIGSAIGVGATYAFTKVRNYLWTKKVQHQRATQTEQPNTGEPETVVIHDTDVVPKDDNVQNVNNKKEKK